MYEEYDDYAKYCRLNRNAFAAVEKLIELNVTAMRIISS